MVSSRPYRISSSVHQPFMATTIAPSEVIAQNDWIHSGALAARMATRSPWPMP